MKNQGNQKRGKEKQQYIPECRKKQGGRKHDRQPQIKRPRFTGLLTGKRPKCFKIPAEGTEQTEQFGHQPTRPGGRMSAGKRSVARRFQTRFSGGR